MGLQFLPTFILCALVFIKYSESTCEVNEKTYDVGETWQETDLLSGCIQHVCQEDGTYSTAKCSPADNEEEDAKLETTVNVLDLDKSLPATESVTETQDNVSGCTLDERIVSPGEQVDVPGKCFYRACAGNEQWIMKACPLIGLTPGWILTPEDVSKSYPDCCGRAAPLLNIIPDVVQSLHWSVTLKLSYSNNPVDYGNELTPSQVKASPEVEFWGDPDSWFLLSMVDADAESKEFLHWLVGNIPGNDVSSGDVLAEYVGSGPPQGSGLHRYVFLLYKQPGNITFEEPVLDSTSFEGRGNFSVAKFSENYNLSDPIALNFFVAQYDDYVPEVHKQLGIAILD